MLLVLLLVLLPVLLMLVLLRGEPKEVTLVQDIADTGGLVLVRIK